MNAADIQSITLAEALARLAQMPPLLHRALADASPEELRIRTDPDSFCLVEQACHLRDLEREGYAVRLQRMLCEDRPVLAQFEGDVVARERRYVEQDAHRACDEFAVARSALIDRAETLGAAQMARTAVFMGRTITVCDLLAMIVEHDRGHREEIAKLVNLRAAI
jgi:hypothetical protein